MKQNSRARHETINRMFKEWSVLKNRFRYSVQKHGIVFGAVANIIQLCIEQGARQPFMVDYNDNIDWIHIKSIYIIICLFTTLMLLCHKPVLHDMFHTMHDHATTYRIPLYPAHDTWCITFIIQYGTWSCTWYHIVWWNLSKQMKKSLP